MSKVKEARILSGMSEEAAAAFSGMSKVTYRTREPAPWKFTFEQFYNLYQEMDDDGKDLMELQLEEMRDRYHVA